MKEPITSKEIWLSVLYVILLVPFAYAIDRGLIWLFNNILLGIINWFNGLTVFWKVITFLFAGGAFVGIFIGVFSAVGNLLSALIFSKLPLNTFVLVCCWIIFLGNVFIGAREAYYIMPAWTFWYLLEFLFLCLTVLCFNFCLLPVFNKKLDKME